MHSLVYSGQCTMSWMQYTRQLLLHIDQGAMLPHDPENQPHKAIDQCNTQAFIPVNAR
jgi:hypothetical protein